mmetsp:Transcript_108798/g.307750  ORF Transcript_108798/g.307750 Transcript_108798/m.307750 type:complete len:370 (-) Transcript_108798:671-1780(-)
MCAIPGLGTLKLLSLPNWRIAGSPIVEDLRRCLLANWSRSVEHSASNALPSSAPSQRVPTRFRMSVTPSRMSAQLLQIWASWASGKSVSGGSKKSHDETCVSLLSIPGAVRGWVHVAYNLTSPASITASLVSSSAILVLRRDNLLLRFEEELLGLKSPAWEAPFCPSVSSARSASPASNCTVADLASPCERPAIVKVHASTPKVASPGAFDLSGLSGLSDLSKSPALREAVEHGESGESGADSGTAASADPAASRFVCALFGVYPRRFIQRPSASLENMYSSAVSTRSASTSVCTSTSSVSGMLAVLIMVATRFSSRFRGSTRGWSSELSCASLDSSRFSTAPIQEVLAFWKWPPLMQSASRIRSSRSR